MTQNPNSDTVTDGIRVRAAAQFLPNESDPDRDQYLYVYRIAISNEGDRQAKLVSRHWIILDAENNRRDVRGPGVVGETPELEPGERFEYTSGCPLSTRWGTMEGSFQMVREDGTEFDAHVGRFFLAPSNPPIVAAAGDPS